MASGHRQPAERPHRRGCRTAARHRRPVEHSNMDPKDQENLQEEQMRNSMDPKDQENKFSIPSFYPIVTHKLPMQQGQDYLEGYYVCA